MPTARIWGLQAWRRPACAGCSRAKCCPSICPAAARCRSSAVACAASRSSVPKSFTSTTSITRPNREKWWPTLGLGAVFGDGGGKGGGLRVASKRGASARRRTARQPHLDWVDLWQPLHDNRVIGHLHSQGIHLHGESIGRRVHERSLSQRKRACRNCRACGGGHLSMPTAAPPQPAPTSLANWRDRWRSTVQKTMKTAMVTASAIEMPAQGLRAEAQPGTPPFSLLCGSWSRPSSIAAPL